MPDLTLPKTIEWIGGLDGCARLIDQTRLPAELVFLECHDLDTLWEAVKTLRVRGAPAIGVAAAMGVVLGLRDLPATDPADFLAALDKVCNRLASARPTAVNLTWALSRQKQLAATLAKTAADMPPPNAADVPLKRRSATAHYPISQWKEALLTEAKKIRDEDEAMCRAIGRHGQSFIPEGGGILTHCNAGSLATAYYGTALAPLYTAHQSGRRFRVYADETRPLLQGSRLTVWELMQAGIDATLLCDNMAAALMKQGKISLIIVGADRIAANGDTANKIGTYGLAVLAKAHQLPFYVAAPTSTFDLSLPDGSGIPIEERGADEIRLGFGKPTAPLDAKCFSPAFDVTPAELISAIVTERGIVRPVNRESIAGIMTRSG